MKRLSVLLIMFQSLASFAQTTIPAFPIKISTAVTTNLVFHYAIESVDRGSQDILVQKAQGLDTILQVKAGRRNFTKTNLSVVTADGKLNSFEVQYAADPDSLNLYFNEQSVTALRNFQAIPALLDKNALTIQEQPEFLHQHVNSEEINLSLKGIYIDQGYLWFRFSVQNHSMIEYRPEYVKIFLRSKKRSRRIALQEYELRPLFRSIASIPGKGGNMMLLAFRQFTVPRHQQLICEMSEKDGGRSQVLPISHKIVLKARALKKQN